MNILVDGRSWSHYSAGISTFFTAAVLEWARQRSDDCFFVLLPKGMDTRIEPTPLPTNIKLLDEGGRYPRWLPNIVILQLLVPRLCRKLHIGLYYAPVPHLPYGIPRKTKTMVTVHDVVNIEMADTMSWTNRLATSVFFSQAIRKADLLWTNSQYTKSKVEAYFPHRRRLEIFTGGAADRQVFYPRSFGEEQKEQIRKKYGISQKFILFTGSLEPRKNLPFLLSLMPELYQQHHLQLVVVGCKHWKASAIKNMVEASSFPQDSTIFCGYVSNKELAALYCCAECFVSASLTEGLGMPQIEALLCGCRVVTAHNTAMIEVAQGKEGAVTVEGYDPQKWKEAILDMVHNRSRVNQKQLEDYDWRRVISKLLLYISKEI